MIEYNEEEFSETEYINIQMFSVFEVGDIIKVNGYDSYITNIHYPDNPKQEISYTVHNISTDEVSKTGEIDIVCQNCHILN